VNEDAPQSIGRNVVERFDRAADAYVEQQQSALGRLRTEAIFHHLSSKLPETAFDVIDVGSGLGEISLRLAAWGAVTALVDPSAQLMARAQRLAQQTLSAEARARVHFATGTIDDLVNEWRGRRFAVVLCHDTIEYMPDEKEAWRALSTLVAPGGLVSVVVPNRFSTAVGSAIRGLIPRAREAVTGALGEPDMTVGVRRRLYDIPTIVQNLHQNGIEPIAIRGVRVFADHMPPQVLENDFDAALALDVEAGAQEAYVGIAKFIHVLGRPHAR
jgi:S-adenosylmethionine-dependent methyltransferase